MMSPKACFMACKIESPPEIEMKVRLFGKVEYYSIFLPIVIDQLDGVVGITEAKTSLDFHAKFS